MKKVLVLLADGFEELEAVATVDVLRRCGFHVATASLSDNRTVRGSHNMELIADESLRRTEVADFDAVVLPGGMPGSINLYNSPEVSDLVQGFAASGKLVAAICAAPIVLAKAGLLKSRKFTMYPGFDKYLGGVVSSGETVDVSDNIITGHGPGAVFAFAGAIANYLGKDPAETYGAMFVKR